MTLNFLNTNTRYIIMGRGGMRRDYIADTHPAACLPNILSAL